MPPIGLLRGGVDLSGLFIQLSGEPVASVAQAKDAGIPILAYGVFINTVIDFVIIAFAIFIVIKQINRFTAKKEEEPKAPPAPPKQEVLLEEIRDLLKKSA